MTNLPCHVACLGLLWQDLPLTACNLPPLLLSLSLSCYILILPAQSSKELGCSLLDLNNMMDTRPTCQESLEKVHVVNKRVMHVSRCTDNEGSVLHGYSSILFHIYALSF